ncbi:hypothetical protein ARMGADRAFT_1068900 [Armillaria gallica]|uniref:Uncharacterized protein n=1 Tax=Armillaria gallica TaxID=47427 RepID=A0A2H3CC63_ARMGA|nr:hypothetical protein ARMGADRAFT_1068900 [Armillaria gallica]
MTLDIAKPGGSKNRRNAPASAGTPPHWADFYRLPVENDIIAGTEWIYCLWAVLHRATPPSYCTFSELDKTARKLCSLLSFREESISLRLAIKAHTRTETLHAIYDILECQGYLQSVFPALINDILQETRASESDCVTFSVDLRRRCKNFGPILERKISKLQKVVIRQHGNLNLKNCVIFLNCLIRGLLTLAFVSALWAFALTFSGIPPKSRILDFECIFLLFCPLLAMITSDTSSCAQKIVSYVDTISTDTFKLIWAVRDMAGLLALIAESDRSPLTDVSHAKRFVEAFQASFLGGHSVLLDLRYWLQGLPDWPDKNFVAHYWDDRDCNNADDDDDGPFMDAPLIA